MCEVIHLCIYIPKQQRLIIFLLNTPIKSTQNVNHNFWTFFQRNMQRDCMCITTTTLFTPHIKCTSVLTLSYNCCTLWKADVMSIERCSFVIHPTQKKLSPKKIATFLCIPATLMHKRGCFGWQNYCACCLTLLLCLTTSKLLRTMHLSVWPFWIGFFNNTRELPIIYLLPAAAPIQVIQPCVTSPLLVIVHWLVLF